MPTTPRESDEVVSGQNSLVEKVKAAGPLRGKMAIFDVPPDPENPLPTHGSVMRDEVLRMGVPEENFTFPADYFTEEAFVVAFPSTWIMLGKSPEGLDLISRHKILFVVAAGNTQTFTSRDLWYPDHRNWEMNPGNYDQAFDAFATGKVIIATYADADVGGAVKPYSETVKCGMAKEFCYSVIRPSDLDPHDDFGQGTSNASVQLGALAFYLFQLWDTPREVVGVLNRCAEDVGEPGIDEEYGRGIVSVVCDTVQNREVGVVADSLQVLGGSPVLGQMTGAPSLLPQSPPSVRIPSLLALRPFYSFRGHSLETMTGHLGGQIFLKGTDLFISGGTDYAPMGIRSSLSHVTRTPFMEFGARRELIRHRSHRLALLGTYGYGARGDFSVHTEHLGIQYEHSFDVGTLSIRTGHRSIRGLVGIRGYRETGADRVPFTDGDTELRLSFIMNP